MPPIWKPVSYDTIRYWIDTIKNEASDKLNDWETNFINDMDLKLTKHSTWSQRQEEIIEKIYAEKTS